MTEYETATLALREREVRAQEEMAAAAATSGAGFSAASHRRMEWLSCLRAAAEARIENEPGLLLAAADALMAGLDKRFPSA